MGCFATLNMTLRGMAGISGTARSVRISVVAREQGYNNVF
jgi:hypothetical protein